MVTEDKDSQNTARPGGRNRSRQSSVVSRNKTTVTDGWQNPIRDPREEALPQMGIVELEDAETGEGMLVDTSDHATREAFASRAVEAREHRVRLFRSIGLDTIDITTASSYVEPLTRFFKARSAKIRS